MRVKVSGDDPLKGEGEQVNYGYLPGFISHLITIVISLDELFQVIPISILRNIFSFFRFFSNFSFENSQIVKVKWHFVGMLELTKGMLTVWRFFLFHFDGIVSCW